MSTAIVTGAGQGLGRAIAHRLAVDGHSVAGLDIDAEALAETNQIISDAGAACRSYVVDLRDESQIDEAVSRSEADLGPLAVVVNNAAIFAAGPFLDTPIAEYDDLVAVNQRAYWLVAQHGARRMQVNGGGAIVNMGSITQHGGWADMASYVVTKGAAAALTRALATELGRHEIRVNCVAPGAFPTRAEDVHVDRAAYDQRIIDSQALKRRGTFAELAAAVSFLVGPDASFVTGQTLNVDGGWIMA